MRRRRIDAGAGVRVEFVAHECDPRVQLVVGHVVVDLGVVLAALPRAHDSLVSTTGEPHDVEVRTTVLDEHDRERLALLRASLLRASHVPA